MLATTAVAPLVKQMLYGNYKGNAATRYGLVQEKARSINTFTHGSVEASVDRNCGLIVLSTYPWLAVTPEGLVIHPSASPLSLEGIVEFKNPYNFRESSLQEEIENKKCSCLINVEGHFMSIIIKYSLQCFAQVEPGVIFFISAKGTVSGRESNMMKSWRNVFCGLTDWTHGLAD